MEIHKINGFDELIISKRREKKTETEAKRRNKLNEQLAALRSMLFDDQSNSNSNSTVTRETLLNSAIQEIAKLRQERHQLKELISKPITKTDTPMRRSAGKFPMHSHHTRMALSDPLNRSSYSMEDLDRAFQTLFAREVEYCCSVSASRPESAILSSIRSLEDVSKQIGKEEYLLCAGILEETFFSTLKFNPKELKRTLEHNWQMYQSIKKADNENLLLFTESEMGAWILTDSSLMEYMTGNFEAAENYYQMAKELSKKLGHRGTHQFMLANIAWSMRGSISVPTAQKVFSILQYDPSWSSTGLLILGNSLLADGRRQEGINVVETAISQMVGNGDDSIDLCLASTLVEAYIQSGNVESGLRCANYMLNQYNELKIEGLMGKAEVLRLKAKLLMMKQYPDYIPEPVATQFVDSSVEDLISMCEPIVDQDKQSSFGPFSSSAIDRYMSYLNNVGSEDIEMILRSAMNLASIKGLCTIELRCTVDLTRFFLHTGDINQATETAQIVKDCAAKMKRAAHGRELQKAQYVIALVEEACLKQ